MNVVINCYLGSVSIPPALQGECMKLWVLCLGLTPDSSSFKLWDSGQITFCSESEIPHL